MILASKSMPIIVIIGANSSTGQIKNLRKETFCQFYIRPINGWQHFVGRLYLTPTHLRKTN
jgi:hypothetical protein